MAALFLTNGAIFANLVPRLPGIKTDLALSNTFYGIVVAAFPTGALVAGLAAGAVLRRFGSARMAVAGTSGIAVLVFVAGSSTTPLLLAAALFVGGACDALTDVAQNAHGLRVQRVYGRSIINSLHAVWSAGALLGGAMGAAAITLHLSRATHLGVSAVVFIAVAAIAYPFLLRGPDATEDHTAGPTARGRPGCRVYGALFLLVVITIAGAVVEDAGSSWATLYLGGLGAVGGVAALGYIALLGFQFIGRLAGDRLVDRFGARAVVRVGGAGHRRRDGARTGLPECARHHRRLRRGGDRHCDRDPRRHARRGPAAGTATRQRVDGGGLVDAGRFRRRLRPSWG